MGVYARDLTLRDCETEAEIDELFAGPSDGGDVFMPLDSYPFSEKFGWVADEFGVFWQLNLAVDHQT